MQACKLIECGDYIMIGAKSNDAARSKAML